MSKIDLLKNAAVGIGVTTGVIIALPILGAAGAISATGAAVAVAIGAGAAIADEHEKKGK
jgi:hypothetical protein